ncbi:hypothetical protein, partial [Streptomyces misionensis]|uniref:hypothetical protein n=1 Tax=Streptomyces misionensis TaxID=67331 RepID=UPI001647CF9F
ANTKAYHANTTSSSGTKKHSSGCSGFWGCAGHYFKKALPVAEKVATVVAVVAVVVVVVVAVAACTETVVAAPHVSWAPERRSERSAVWPGAPIAWRWAAAEANR